MEKPITKVAKSKSSNSTRNNEPRKSENNKKSRSNAKFKPRGMKKRGVYVEKKETMISINEQDLSAVALQKKVSNPPPIPRPGRKRFLNSVLTILSQSTTGTQYPDKGNAGQRSKLKLINKKDDEIIREDTNTTRNTTNSSKKKPRYRSKIINDNDLELDQLVILQSTKEITHTPSNYSEKSGVIYKKSDSVYKGPEHLKWAEILSPLTNKENLDNVSVPEDNRNIQELKKDNQVDNDPSTLLAQMPKKDEKKLYNFFVDLLETTFNVYNVKTPFNPLPSSVASSKVNLEINESVAKKLNIEKPKDSEPPCNDDITKKPSSSKYFYIEPDEKERWDDNKLLDHFQPKPYVSKRTVSPSKSFRSQKKLQSESFNYKKVPVSNVCNVPTKKYVLKKERKKNFMNYLKEQLKMEDEALEEPRNIYQALKVIARNKRRCQKSIHFQNSKKTSDADVHVCQFKRRRLLSGPKLSNKKANYHPQGDIIQSKHSNNMRNVTPNFKKRTIIITPESDKDSSRHSIEVFGYDYEPNKKVNKNGALSFQSTISSDLDNYSYFHEGILNVDDSGSSSMMTRYSSFANKHELRNSLMHLLN